MCFTVIAQDIEQAVILARYRGHFDELGVGVEGIILVGELLKVLVDVINFALRYLPLVNRYYDLITHVARFQVHDIAEKVIRDIRNHLFVIFVFLVVYRHSLDGLLVPLICGFCRSSLVGLMRGNQVMQHIAEYRLIIGLNRFDYVLGGLWHATSWVRSLESPLQLSVSLRNSPIL